MNTMERLYKQAFWSCFGGLAMIGSFALLPLDIIVRSIKYESNTLQLSIFIAFDVLCCTVIAYVLAWLVPLYANVTDRHERVRRLVELCRFGRWAMLYANPVGLIFVASRLFWRKVLVPAGIGLGWRLCFLLMCAMPENKSKLR